MTLVIAHAGHWLFALPPLTMVIGLVGMVVAERVRAR
jgi:hypothetical protein